MYGDHSSGNPFTQLKVLCQEGSMDEYAEEIELLAAQISPLSDEQYLGVFIGGLKEEIRFGVQPLEPPNCYKPISTSRMTEEINS